MEKENLKEKAGDLTSHVSDLAKTYYQLALLNVSQQAAKIASGAILGIVSFVLAVFVLFFAGFALSWWLGNLIESRIGGFLLVAAIYFLIIVILWTTRNKFISPMIRNAIIRKIHD
jgi:hypothetical protein